MGSPRATSIANATAARLVDGDYAFVAEDVRPAVESLAAEHALPIDSDALDDCAHTGPSSAAPSVRLLLCCPLGWVCARRKHQSNAYWLSAAQGRDAN